MPKSRTRKSGSEREVLAQQASDRATVVCTSGLVEFQAFKKLRRTERGEAAV